MAIDKRVGTKVEKSYKKEESAAIRVDPYPYIGLVKNNVDPTRTGRLQVWVPDLGGDENDPQNWTTVSYASPFMGTTNQKSGSTQNSFEQASHTYGMWMVPPDIGVEVIVLFIGGYTSKGYWIACTNSSLSRYMMPGLASTTLVDTEFSSANVKSTIVKGFQYPVTEFNSNAKDLNLTKFNKIAKPVHEEQYQVLINQGLDRDNTRGTITSSSQRETPSNVFGISTPGRSYKTDPADDPKFLQKIKEGKVTQDDYAVTSRKGGHTFVMDDGSSIGADQLVRLRTAKGHQLMMHDTDNVLYIANADGTVWVEFNSSGRLDIFSTAGFNIRTKGSINMHADQNISLNAGGKFQVRAENRVQFDTPKFNVLAGTGGLNLQTAGKAEFKTGGNFIVHTEGKLSLKASGKIILDAGALSLITEVGDTVKALTGITLNSLPDTLKGADGVWKVSPSAISSIVTIAPGHEPFYLRVIAPPPPEQAAAKITPQATFKGKSSGAGTAGADSTKNTAGTTVSSPATDKDIRNQPVADSEVGPLSKDQVTALNAQIHKSQTSDENTAPTGDDEYSMRDSALGTVGKYQFDHQDLIDMGYVKSSVTSNDDLSNPNSWTGKDGIESLDGYYASPTVQESMMAEKSTLNYNELVSNGTIAEDDDPETVAGLLCVAHDLGPEAATEWRSTGSVEGGAEAYQAGRYAVAVMAPKVAEINAG